MTMTSNDEHWDERYRGTPVEKLTWYQVSPQRSLELVRAAAAPSDAIVDVGAGSSTLADHLLRLGYERLTVVDCSEAALSAAMQRLGAQAARVKWRRVDLTEWVPDEKYKLWHDRATLHFFVRDEERAAYRRALMQGLELGGVFVVGSFSIGGPEKCSGLPVRQYDRERLQAFLGEGFVCRRSELEQHRTPDGGTQMFHWAVFERTAL